MTAFFLASQGVRRVCDCRSSSQGGGDHRGLDHLGVGYTRLAGVTAVDINALGALSRESNGDGNQFLVLYRNGSLGDSRLVKCPKRPSSLPARGFPFS